MPYHDMPCHAMPCYAMPYHDIPFHDMPYHAMPLNSMNLILYPPMGKLQLSEYIVTIGVMHTMLLMNIPHMFKSFINQIQSFRSYVYPCLITSGTRILHCDRRIPNQFDKYSPVGMCVCVFTGPRTVQYERNMR